MKARAYQHHRAVSRLITLDALLIGAAVLIVAISGAATYYAVISRMFGAITGALLH